MSWSGNTDTSLSGLDSNLSRLWATSRHCRRVSVVLYERQHAGFRWASRGSTSKGPRDSGCSTAVVRRSLVPEDKLTGQEERCILIDGTVRRTLVARIHISTPFYTGMTKAVCMNNPLFDVIVGNVPGSTGLPFTSPRNRKRRYTGRPWFRNFSKKKSQVLRGFC